MKWSTTETLAGLATSRGRWGSHGKVSWPCVGDDGVAGRSQDLESATTGSREGMMTLSRWRRSHGKVSGPWFDDDGVAGRSQYLRLVTTGLREGLMTLSRWRRSREKVSWPWVGDNGVTGRSRDTRSTITPCIPHFKAFRHTRSTPVRPVCCLIASGLRTGLVLWSNQQTPRARHNLTMPSFSPPAPGRSTRTCLVPWLDHHRCTDSVFTTSSCSSYTMWITLDPAVHRVFRTKFTCLFRTRMPLWLRPFALVLHLQQRKPNCILHLQY
jgi:hypothetical protein